MTGAFSLHGGRLSEACTWFGGEREDWLDLSTGINPLPWQGAPGLAPDWHLLPEPADLACLERIAAAHFGVDPALCLAVAGSEVGLRGLATVLGLFGRHDRLAYGTYAQAFASPPEGSDAEAPTVLVIGNPNNPDGRIRGRAVLLAALARQEMRSGWLIVDEAFADCLPEWSVADEVGEERRLIVTRSFGKFFGLAGVRLGFVLGPSAVLAQLRHLQGEWPICAAAIAYGTAAYADASWIAQTRCGLFAAVTRLDRLLLRHGLIPKGSCPLFRLIETDAARHLFTALAERRILTRPFADHSRLLRLGLPAGENALGRLAQALAEAGRHG